MENSFIHLPNAAVDILLLVCMYVCTHRQTDRWTDRHKVV